MRGVGDATNDAPISPTPTSGGPSLAEPPDIQRHPDQPSLQTHEAPVGPSPVLDSPPGPLPNEPHVTPSPGNFGRDYLFSIVHGMHTAHADDSCTVPTSDDRPKESDFEVAAQRIDEIAEVTQVVIPPFYSDHTSASGARSQGSEVEGEEYPRASEVVWSSPCSPNTV